MIPPIMSILKHYCLSDFKNKYKALILQQKIVNVQLLFLSLMLINIHMFPYGWFTVNGWGVH